MQENFSIDTNKKAFGWTLFEVETAMQNVHRELGFERFEELDAGLGASCVSRERWSLV